MIDVFSHSEVGGHIANEDAFIVAKHPVDGNWLICALADGQGGRAGGGQAARVAVQQVVDLATRQSPEFLDDNWEWERILRNADVAVTNDPNAGFTTLIGFCIHENRLVGASNGDSAVAIFDFMRDAWAVTANQYKNPPVGSGDAKFVTFATDLEPRWKVLAMSDGVWKYTRWENIIQAGKTLHGQELIDTLLQSARMKMTRQLQDDFTIVVLQGGR